MVPDDVLKLFSTYNCGVAGALLDAGVARADYVFLAVPSRALREAIDAELQWAGLTGLTIDAARARYEYRGGRAAKAGDPVTQHYIHVSSSPSC